MPDEILFDYFTARGEPGWHQLGTVFPADEKVTLIEAGQRTGLDFHTEMFPVYVKVGSQEIIVPDHKAIVREPLPQEPHWVPLSVVGKNYKQVTNTSLFTTFNELSDVFPVETIGALGKGERIFVALDAGMVDIKGDPVHQFFTLYDEKSGRASTKAFFTPVRVVCANTLCLGLAEATLTLNVSHVTGNIKRLEHIAEVALDMKRRMNNITTLFNGMAEVAFSMEDFREALKVIYPMPIEVTQEFEALAEKAQAHWVAAESLFEKFNDEQPRLANTEWGAYQAVVELEDWKKGRGNGRYASALLGERADTKKRAFSVITSLL